MTSRNDKDTRYSRSGNGEILPKDDPLFETLGSIDELNAHIGFLISQLKPSKDRRMLTGIQKKLSEIMSDLAFAEKINIEDTSMSKLKPVPDKQDTNSSALSIPKRFSGGEDLIEEIDRLKKQAGHVETFVQPGADKTSALIHIARTVCRRAERKAVSMQRIYFFPDEVLSYINKLSEYFFYLSLISEREKK
jgi:cob(I)alamin adenosyltransferase